MKTPTKVSPIPQFIEEIETMKNFLEKILTMANENMELDPDNINWGNVGDLVSYNSQLEQIHNSIFKEGEFAN